MPVDYPKRTPKGQATGPIKSPFIDEREILFSRGKDPAAAPTMNSALSSKTTSLAKHRATSPLVNLMQPAGGEAGGGAYEFNPTIFP